uniref:mitochondrial ornithine transporter 1 n=1 Tax=Myxine glutinosa TaxID=7769 RepID=UPI00358E1ABC
MHLNPAVEAVVDIMSGTAGGVACVYSGQPFDTVKVKMQTFPSLYRTFLRCMVQTFKEEGIQGIYRGSTPALAANISENAMLFLSYGLCQRLVRLACQTNNDTRLSDMQMACSGSLAAWFSSIVICPLELIKCRMQATREMHAAGKSAINVSNCTAAAVMRAVLQTEGVRGFFHGMASTWIRDIPGYFFFFWGNEFSKSLLTPAGKTKDDLGPLSLVLSGGLGGVALWAVVYPIDSVKSRIQVMSMAGERGGLLVTLSRILRHEGLRALYAGFTPTIIRAFPANGALFLAYEYTKDGMTRMLLRP